MKVENFPNLTDTDMDLLETAIATNMRFARIKSTPALPNGFVAAIGVAEGINNPTHGYRPDLNLWKQIATPSGVPVKQSETAS